MTQSLTHPVYRVRAALPAGWVADATAAPIYPADEWTLHPAATDGAPAVTLILGWLPRGGRHSAMFPGGRLDDAHATTRRIGGVEREGTGEGNDRYFKIDFDVGELAVSIATAAATDGDRPVIDAILDQLAFDAAARPPGFPSPARHALELARGWATANGFPTAGIVFVGQPPGTTAFAFTVFHAGGLVPLRVDGVTVTRMPL